MTFISGTEDRTDIPRTSKVIQTIGEPLRTKSADLLLPASILGLQKEFLYFTALNWNSIKFDLNNLQDALNNFSLRDDVWSYLFLDFVLLLTASDDGPLIDYQEIPWTIRTSNANFQDGPYIVQTSTGRIYKAGCQYEDTHAAFVSRPTPVQSRLYHIPSQACPLAGLRFTIKDVIDVRGMETTCGNQQYGQLYGCKETTAACVQRLMDAGAELVGKTKTSMFEAGVNSACNWTDTLCPFNPRGDGFQKASSSSTGSAVACAAYDWIDFTLGADTGGSVRFPAAVNGIYGSRLSSSFNCEQSRKHMIISSTALDTVGVFARSSKILRQVSSLVVGPQYSSAIMRSNLKALVPGSGVRILYPIQNPSNTSTVKPKWFPIPQGRRCQTPNDVAGAHFERLTTALETMLQTKRIAFDFADLWRRTHPPALSDNIDEALDATYRDNVYYEGAKKLVDPFISDWKKNYKVRAPTSGEQPPNPFIIPIVERRIDYGRNVTETQYDAANFSMAEFSQWVRDVLFRHSIDDNEKAILILPRTWGLPDYRFEDDTPVSGPVFPWAGFQPANISGFSDCPDFTIPVGEVPYQSKVTGRQEWLPCSVGLLADPENDAMLFDLLDMLEEKGILKRQLTGPRMYDDRESSPGSRL